MKKAERAILNVLMWTYERGSWQYDVMCILITALILFTPRGFFHGDFKGGESHQPVIEKSQPSVSVHK